MEIQFRINLDGPHWMQHWSRQRKLIVSSALLLLLLPGWIVLAHHLPFTDIPTSGPTHDAVGAIYGAGITGGTSATTYSPTNPVTREQMALFLHRGLPRVAYRTGDYITLNNGAQDMVVVTIYTGGVPGQTRFVKLDASILAYTDSTSGCPCNVFFYTVRDGDLGQDSATHFATVYSKFDPVIGAVGGGITSVFQVPTASTQTFRLKMGINSGGAGATVYGKGALTALYVPFGSTGTNTLAAQPSDEEQPAAPSNDKPELPLKLTPEPQIRRSSQ
jgi:hypothetical protein